MKGPFIVMGLLLLIIVAWETYAVETGKPTLSDGVWAATRAMAKNYPYGLTLLGFILGTFFGHLFFSPCEFH